MRRLLIGARLATRMVVVETDPHRRLLRDEHQMPPDHNLTACSQVMWELEMISTAKQPAPTPLERAVFAARGWQFGHAQHPINHRALCGLGCVSALEPSSFHNPDKCIPICPAHDRDALNT